MVLAGEIVEFLNKTITSEGKQKIGVQFGAYATFASFFGLAGLQNVNDDFRGVVDYASSMTFELFTNSSVTVSADNYPSEDEIYVRFLFSNGTATNESEPTPYPLFGSGQTAISWKDFTTGMDNFAIRDNEHWCTICGGELGQRRRFSFCLFWREERQRSQPGRERRYRRHGHPRGRSGPRGADPGGRWLQGREQEEACGCCCRDASQWRRAQERRLDRCRCYDDSTNMICRHGCQNQIPSTHPSMNGKSCTSSWSVSSMFVSSCIESPPWQ